eukprot:TRINITY_DN102802_c0_g1_i1.p1 TRINITY_DN102802_c0_g1~~TRINITY_DN102802_c0_g1_i1.p1  ORF type:complete len:298 (+),score=36.27 TRINITY_DN102802_c0_g1_i1:43-936(+)
MWAARAFRPLAPATAAAGFFPAWLVSCEEPKKLERRPRVLVTGFHDWRELGPTPNLWRCRDNPSCRLILGAPTSSPPVMRTGELVQALGKQCPEVEFSFQTLTTTWGTAQTVDYLGFDVVVHIGLGVYDSHCKIIVEKGAYNSRRGKDAAGHEAGPTIDMGGEPSLYLDRMSRVVSSLDGQNVTGFEVEAHSARFSNSYICNETHWRSLKALQIAQDNGDMSALKGCFFVHIPVPAKETFRSEQERKAYESFSDLSDDTDYSKLALGVAGVVAALIRESTADKTQPTVTDVRGSGAR